MTDETTEPEIPVDPPVEEPEQPTDPNEPIEEPEVPEESTEPSEPIEEPEIPEESTEPSEPVEEPEIPEESTEPSEPVEEPEIPEESTEPSEPVEEPEIPDESTAPEKPVNSPDSNSTNINEGNVPDQTVESSESTVPSQGNEYYEPKEDRSTRVEKPKKAEKKVASNQVDNQTKDQNDSVVSVNKKKVSSPKKSENEVSSQWVANQPEDIDIKSGDTEYKIQWGDTLWAISIKADTTIASLVELNGIENPDLIYAGDILRLK
ncbi:LysM peptidoglycan-binding domain-containing protein [Enterococcus faecalis]|nr:LysM peptidoglycan-binding domain-containing protein [Enterococcus faecalis]